MTQTTEQALLGELGFILVHTPDVAAARQFYVERLGMRLESETPAFLIFERPVGAGASFAVGQSEAEQTSAPVAPELWWVVADVDALHTTLVARGVPIVSPPQEQPFGRTLAFADPAGNTIYVYRPR